MVLRANHINYGMVVLGHLTHTHHKTIGLFCPISPSKTCWDTRYLYDFDAKQWKSGPTMSAKRVSPGCTSFVHNDKVNVVVAGGVGSYSNTVNTPYYDSTELLLPETEDGWQWIPGPTLPIKVNAPAMVTLDDTVYLLGGSVQLEHPMIEAVDTIFQLQTYPSYEWINSNNYLKVARTHFKAFKVPGDYIRDTYQDK